MSTTAHLPNGPTRTQLRNVLARGIDCPVCEARAGFYCYVRDVHVARADLAEIVTPGSAGLLPQEPT